MSLLSEIKKNMFLKGNMNILNHKQSAYSLNVNMYH